MKRKIALGLSYFAPLAVLAVADATGGTTGGGASITSILTKIKEIFDLLIPFFITLALLYFIWGVISYIMKQDNEEGRTAARAIMINGIIALFVIVSVWGLVAVLNTTLGIDAGGGGGEIPTPPALPS